MADDNDEGRDVFDRALLPVLGALGGALLGRKFRKKYPNKFYPASDKVIRRDYKNPAVGKRVEQIGTAALNHPAMVLGTLGGAVGYGIDQALPRPTRRKK